MFGHVTTPQLDSILKGVSRSIFLTLQVAPRSMRPVVGVAYLFCRAADTIADTRLLSQQVRLEYLGRFRAQFECSTPRFDEIACLARQVGTAEQIPEEQRLLKELSECFRLYLNLDPHDRDRIRRLVTTLTRGMETDLTYFPAEESGRVKALESDAALDHYTYHVAGCVGEFWTELQVAHVRALASWDLSIMSDRGMRFGKGLQLTNILRDVDGDLQLGRCYLPEPWLRRVGTTAEELRTGTGRDRLLPLLARYLHRTLDFYQSGWDYVLSIPRRAVRLRLACAWPLLIGLRTLEELALSESPYAHGTVRKITRPEIYQILRSSTFRSLSNRALTQLYHRLESQVQDAIARLPQLPSDLGANDFDRLSVMPLGDAIRDS